jgi:glycosyltransferase involved in cell wall biosynthesis
MVVSVVIPAFNEEAHIEACLASLESQTLSPSLFEVIVVDNGSTDSTAAIAQSFLSKIPLRVVSTPRRSISAARNTGAALAQGSELVFVDADCRANPTWLQDFVDLPPENGIRGCNYEIPSDSTWVGRYWTDYQARLLTGPVSFVPGGGLFLSKANFDAIGGFDEQVETSEDIDLCARATKHGLTITSHPILAVIHDGTPRTITHFYRQHRWHGRHVLRNFIENLPSMKNAPVVVVSTYTLLMFWITVLLIPALFLGHPWWTVLAVALLILPPALLALWMSRGAIKSIGPLFALYETYFLARAASLVHVLRNEKIRS